MAAIERKIKRYPIDLTDEEWNRIAPLLPKPARHGRKPVLDLRVERGLPVLGGCEMVLVSNSVCARAKLRFG